MPTIRRIAFCTALATLFVGVSVASATVKQFRSPSGNIGCVFAKLPKYTGVRCDIREQDNPVMGRPDNCELDYGTAYGMRKQGKAGRLCAGDTALEPKAKVLGYGKTKRFKGMACTSMETGMRCTNTSGHGFELSRSAQTLF